MQSQAYDAVFSVVRTGSPSSKRHTRAFLSLEAVTTCLLSLVTQTESTDALCPSSVRNCAHSLKEPYTRAFSAAERNEAQAVPRYARQQVA
eukprot:6212496-Pleurochrysis_carterae.AAC.1